MITSISNSQIKNIILLQKKSKARKDQSAFIVEGVKLFEEAKSLNIIIKAYVMEGYLRENNVNANEYFGDINYEVVSDAVFRNVADTVTPQGILAIVRMPFYQWNDIICHSDANLLLLENLRDPGNLGTIIRTAEGAGVTGIILSKESVDIFNPKVVRSTMGSVFRIPFYYVEDFTKTILLLKEKNIQIFATHLSGEKDFTEADYRVKCGIIVGNEASGISQEAADLADQLVKIPMEGKVESLNAGIAAALMMYETHRQRSNKKQ